MPRFLRPTRKRVGRTSIAWAAALSALLVLTGCSRGASGERDYLEGDVDRVTLAGDTRTIKVGVLRQPHLSHPLFYDAYLPENIELTVVPFANSTEIKNAVVTGDLDFGVTGITSALQGAANGEPVVVVSGAADGGSAIVVDSDSDARTIADLRGKRIGFVPGSSQDILLRLSLRAAGLDANTDVRLTNVQYADMAAALARGDIDAFSGAETGISDALIAGSGRILVHPYDTPIGKINIAMVTTAARIAADRDLVTAMVEVHARATDFMKAEPDRWKQAVESNYGVRPDALGRAVDNIELRWRIDQGYVDQARMLGAEQLALGQIKAEPDYGRFIDLSFTSSVG